MSDAGAADGVGVRLIPKDPVEAAPTGPMEELPDQSLVQGRRVPVAGQRNRRNSQTDTKEDHASWILSIEKADATQNQAAAKIQGLYRMMKGKARVSSEWPQLPYTVYWFFSPHPCLRAPPLPSHACWLGHSFEYEFVTCLRSTTMSTVATTTMSTRRQAKPHGRSPCCWGLRTWMMAKMWSHQRVRSFLRSLVVLSSGALLALLDLCCDVSFVVCVPCAVAGGECPCIPASEKEQRLASMTLFCQYGTTTDPPCHTPHEHERHVVDTPPSLPPASQAHPNHRA